MTFPGATVLLTGPALGIGQATAARAARLGADVIGIDLDAERQAETVALVEAAGRRYTALAADVTEAAALQDAVTEAAGLGFDVVVTSAGVAPVGRFVDADGPGATMAAWRRTIEVNLLGTMATAHAALPHLIAKGAGHVVTLASVAGHVGVTGIAAYSASKHGVVGFSEALSAELDGSGVGVSWICPTLIRTRMTEGIAATPLAPKLEPEDVARAITEAVERGRREVFVPRRMRVPASLVPALFPRLARRMLARDATSKGWLAIRRGLPE
ncbi:MAG: SDR family NAD(P)-dependent oxidoreductase [Bacteroidota bacterium]